MIDNNNQPQAVYTKEGAAGVPPTLSTTPTATTPTASTTPLKSAKKKFLGMDLKIFGVIAGLLSFLIIGGAILLTTGILEEKESVAPTLPKAAEELDCTLSFIVAAAPTPTPTATPSPTPSPTPEPEELECNSSCNPDDDQCSEANSNYYCSVTYGERCRHADFPAEEDCESEEPEPTPAPGCNDICETSSDCANPDHICFETSSGMRCRLDEYPWSAYCVRPAGVVEKRVYTPGVEVVEEVVEIVQEQPKLPEELPETGLIETLRAVTVGGGAAVMLGILAMLMVF